MLGGRPVQRLVVEPGRCGQLTQLGQLAHTEWVAERVVQWVAPRVVQGDAGRLSELVPTRVTGLVPAGASRSVARWVIRPVATGLGQGVVEGVADGAPAGRGRHPVLVGRSARRAAHPAWLLRAGGAPELLLRISGSWPARLRPR